MAARYCRPSDIVTAAAALTLSGAAAQANFPVANLADRQAHTVFKATATGVAIIATFGGARTLQALALINSNLNGATITVTNSAGFNRVLTAPTLTEDGQRLDTWADYRGLANTSAAVWTVTIAGAPANVAIGELLLIATLRELPILWGVVEDEAHPAKVLTTEYGVRLKYGMGVRSRGVKVRVDQETYRADVLALQRDAKGPFSSFLFVQDDDPLYVDLTSDGRSYTRTFLQTSVVDLQLTEQQKGWL